MLHFCIARPPHQHITRICKARPTTYTARQAPVATPVVASCDRFLHIPNGTSLTVYSEYGATITGDLGRVIESGGDVSKFYRKTYSPGDLVPNYTLYPPEGTTVIGGNIVKTKTTLDNLLTPNMGNVQWAACTEVLRHPSSSITYDVSGVYKTSNLGIINQITKY